MRRLYLTDVGFFPCAQDHYRERKDGIEEYILIYCTEGKGVIRVEGREYHLGPNQAFCIPRWRGHRYWACGEEPWSILWVHFKGEDTAFYPLEEERLVSFSGIHEENRMMFLFDLLFRALGGTIRWEILSISLRCFPSFWESCISGSERMAKRAAAA